MVLKNNVLDEVGIYLSKLVRFLLTFVINLDLLDKKFQAICTHYKTVCRRSRIVRRT